MPPHRARLIEVTWGPNRLSEESKDEDGNPQISKSHASNFLSGTTPHLSAKAVKGIIHAFRSKPLVQQEIWVAYLEDQREMIGADAAKVEIKSRHADKDGTPDWDFIDALEGIRRQAAYSKNMRDTIVSLHAFSQEGRHDVRQIVNEQDHQSADTSTASV